MPRILVVDDNADSLEALCKHLKDCEYGVDCVPNGTVALEYILHKAPDLVILDLILPQLDGCSLLEILRAYLRLKTLPVIVLTALSDSPMVERARALGVNAILMKGKATLEEIAEAVRTELHRAPH
jgi:CheY-like chemotaxis protein